MKTETVALEDHHGGMRKGGSAPLAGGAGRIASDSAFCWREACSGVGGTRPPRLAPEGKRERGDQNLPAAAGLFNLQGVTEYRCS